MARIISGKTFASVYGKILKSIYLCPEFVSSPRGMKTHEVKNLLVEIEDTSKVLFKNKVRSIPKRYLAGELIWYFFGRNDLKFISRYSNFWEKLSLNGKLNSAYGNLIFTELNNEGISEWEWAREVLLNDRNTRQSIIRFNKSHHSYVGNKDFVCTLTGIFSIRNNKLDLTITMRSNDVFFGMTFDYPFFMLLQHQMRLHLLKYYPELELGKFTHFIASAHIYERNFETIGKMLNYRFIPEALPILNSNLVCPNGTPTYEMNKLVEAVLNPHIKYNEHSDFYNWLYENAKDK